MELIVEDLACARGGIPVLEGVTFTVPAGRALVLRGPNGSGKTTLLRTLAGLQPALSGETRPGAEAMAYQSHADGLKATMTVRETLGFWAQIFGIGDITHAVEGFGLAPLIDRPAGALSAGQKRRLGLARLLVTGRPVWILDEPTVSLDTDGVAQFAEVVRTHLTGGGSALIATHIDLGIDAPMLDIAPFRAAIPAPEEDGF